MGSWCSSLRRQISDQGVQSSSSTGNTQYAFFPGEHMKIVLLTLLCLPALACDGGLEPPATAVQVPMGTMTGLVTYRNWPPIDSLHDLRLVAFRNFPPRDILTEVLQGRAAVYPPIGDSPLVPFFVDSLRFIFVLPAGTYEYVAIAQQYGPSISTDWRAVGQYDLDTNLTIPSSVEVIANDTTGGVDIDVDFNNPPPPPFL